MPGTGERKNVKLSNILKLHKRQTIIRKDRASFKEFLNTFVLEQVNPTECSETHDLTIYLSIITMDTVDPDLETQQALAFIAGYAAFSEMKKLSKTSELCLDCTSFLCEDKCLDVEEIQPTFQLIQLSDRGGLKWPSKQVFSAVITLWKIFVEIEHFPLLLKDFLISRSRAKLVQLTILKLESEDCDDWAYSSHCFVEGKEVLHGILVTASNCFLNNMAKNINSDRIQSHSKESGRKILKLS